MTKHCIEKTKSDLEYQRFSPDISSPANIWNIYDDESDEEESSSNDYNGFTDNICLIISKFWNERDKHINNDYDVNGCILCLITNIREDVFKH